MNVTVEQIFERVTAIVVEKLNIEPAAVHRESTMQDLGADSLDMVEIIMRIEEAFGITVNDADAEQLYTMNDVVHYIAVQLQKK
jgi:acyl carrier protein